MTGLFFDHWRVELTVRCSAGGAKLSGMAALGYGRHIALVQPKGFIITDFNHAASGKPEGSVAFDPQAPGMDATI
ncbi:hypothetical protein [Sphingomonas sp. GM_Shp_2]|uniref:hypothetical protein n=1 Tax=Sphingomonas sp. GM_Shp_2 TaxID=2937380 RepID=UPI002269CBEE|nr:hypothetical protein [Sphingomonas sp. GM_Shp_2]